MKKVMEFISEDEKQTIQSARKVLEKLVKRYTRLREKGSYINCKHYKMYKELIKLKIDVDIDKYEDDETVQLSLNSKTYGYPIDIF